MRRLRPIRGFALLVDDPAEQTEGGVVVPTGSMVWRKNMDYVVAAVGHGAAGFGVGDRVVLRDANAGRSLYLDGIAYRLVRTSDVIGRVG